mgnify:FL=1
METNQNRDTIIEYKDTSMEEIIKKIEQGESLTLDEIATFCKTEGKEGLQLLKDIGYPLKDFTYHNGDYKFVFEEDAFSLNMEESKDDGCCERRKS